MEDVYRTNAEKPSEHARRRDAKARTIWILAVSLAVHAGVLAAAFVARAAAPAETTRVVRVLAGHVDSETGAFNASGLADARIKR